MGFIVPTITPHETTMESPKHELFENLLNSIIVAAIAFFSTLTATGFPPSGENVYAAIVAFFLAFFSRWAIERGIQGDGGAN